MPRVAWLVLASCGSPFKPVEPPPEPAPGIVNKLSPPAPGAGHEVLVGEWCPNGAAGRPAVAPLLVRNVGWSDTPADVSAVVERGSVPRFAVYGTDGKLAGAFDTMGVVDVGLPQEVAAGSYAGGPPCSSAAIGSGAIEAGSGSGTISTRTDDAKCAAALGGCGLAVGPVTNGDVLPDVPAFQTGGACLSGDALAVDIDGDGRIESFPLVGLLDGERGPASEWTASPTAIATCKPSFQLYGVKLVRPPEPGKAVDPRSTVTMDLLGVVDLDGDGRKELVIALQYPQTRSIVVYTAPDLAQRLELAGEATAFPKP